MGDVTFYRLGQDIEAEAPRLKALYMNDGIDDAIWSEFTGTVRAYQSLDIAEVVKRMGARYRLHGPDAIGVVAVLGRQHDAGASITGPKDVINPLEEDEIISGVNVSGWILAQFRGRKIGSRLIAHTTKIAEAMVDNVDEPSWYGKQIWTSIRPENTPSRRACEAIGFVEVGTQVEEPERLLYIIPR